MVQTNHFMMYRDVCVYAYWVVRIKLLKFVYLFINKVVSQQTSWPV